VRLPPLERQIKPCAEAIAPTTTLINNSAVPGLPPGNVENSLCSEVLPKNSACNPRQRYTDVAARETRHPGIFSSLFRGMSTRRDFLPTAG
jgi:hypothetical protein